MTEEEKDILQDKVIREEANYFESNQHKALLAEDDDYRMSFNLKEGIARAAAKQFIQSALETPIIKLDDQVKSERQAVRAQASRMQLDSGSQNKQPPIAKRFWMGIAASILVAVVSTFMLADFRSANEFVTAQLESGYQSDYSFRDNQLSRGAMSNWILAFEEKNYDLVVEELDWISVPALDSLKGEEVELRQILRRYQKEYQVLLNSYSSTPDWGQSYSAKLNLLRIRVDSIENQLLLTNGKQQEILAIQPTLEEARFALGISKLFAANSKGDFGVEELNWLSSQSVGIDSVGLSSDEISWYLSLAQYKEGNCQEAHATLQFVTKGDSEYRKKAKKLRKKLRKECNLN